MKQAPSHVLRTGYFSLLFDLSRGKQALLSVSQPVLGAILALGQMPDARIMIIGLVAAVTGYFAVFSLNDVLDYKIDREALKVGKAEVADGDIDGSARSVLDIIISTGLDVTLERRFGFGLVYGVVATV